MEIIHSTTNRSIAKNVKYAHSMLDRMLGVMFIKEMKGMDGLLIDPCNSIHNCFVRFSLDVIFIDKENKVVKIIRDFRPWRFTRIYFKSRKVLELPAGSLIDNISIGDQLEVRGV